MANKQNQSVASATLLSMKPTKGYRNTVGVEAYIQLYLLLKKDAGSLF